MKKIAISALNTEPNDPCTITRVSLMPIVVGCIAHIDSHRLSEYEIFNLNAVFIVPNTYYYECKLWAINVYCTSIVGEEIIKDSV